MEPGPVTISVCVCTYKRPELLSDLLKGVAAQRLAPGISIEVVVADNDENRSAKDVLAKIAAETGLRATYTCEPKRNISLARNAAIRSARGALVAFIDDDERPVEEWLDRLYATLASRGGDGVLGPVVPDYPPGAPPWLKKADLFERRRLPTGAQVTHRDARTGNLLLRKESFTEDGDWFDPAFGETGGEDSDFFRRQFARGRAFVWCDEAVVLETVVPQRWTVGFHIARQWRSGSITGAVLRQGQLPWVTTAIREAAYLAAGAAVAVPAMFLPRHLSVRVWLKVAYASGLLGALAGFWTPSPRG